MPRSEEVVADGASAVGVVPGERPEALAAAVGPAYATWGQRVVAAILDNAILAGITWLALGAGFSEPTLTPRYGADGAGWPRDPLILIPIAALAILLVLQALTGWTPGKLVVGIRVVRESSSVPAGLWTTLRRWALHLLDAILLIGYLQPLWHAKRQTFADSIVHTVVVQELPAVPRRQGVTVYAAALLVCALGLGYCLPITGGSSSAPGDVVTCEPTRQGPLLTAGDITLGGSMRTETDRRLWTVRETRTVHPAATISWVSDPSVRDVGYRIELDARPSSADGEPMVSRSWDIGTGGVDDPSGDGAWTHTREISPDGDTHDADVELTDAVDDDLGDELRALGTRVRLDVRLVADGEVLAECGGTLDYEAVDDRSS